MFRKLLNVGKGHSADKLQQQQQQQKQLFQLNEIKSYGFSHLCCLGYSSTLSLLAVGSKHGLLRVLGNASVEFSYQLESNSSIRQIEFIDCKQTSATSTTSLNSNNSKRSQRQQQDQQQREASQEQKSQSANDLSAAAKLIVLTDNGQLHLFEFKTCRQLNFSDNTTQTDQLNNDASADCCQPQPSVDQQLLASVSEYTKLERVASLDYFKFKPDDDDRSKRITTVEVSADGQTVFIGTEGGNVYQVTLDKFYHTELQQHVQKQDEGATKEKDGQETKTTEVIDKIENDANLSNGNDGDAGSKVQNEESTDVNLSDEPQIVDSDEIKFDADEPFDMIKFDEQISQHLGDDIKSKKQGAIESIKKHPTLNNKLLLSYHRGLSVIYDVLGKTVDKYFYHNQVLESSCFADQNGDFFYTSHNDGSYIKWDTRKGSQAKANEDFLGQLYGPYPCKPTPKIQAFSGLVNDQFEELVFFSGGMPRATYDDKNPVTIVRAEPDGKDSIKTVLDFTSKVLDFVVITRPQGNLGAGAKSSGGASANSGGGGRGKKNKKRGGDHHNQQQQQQKKQQANNPVAVALAILAEEEFVVIDLLNSESYLEFALPYLNCVHSSAITCNQHYSDISDELYEQLLAYNKQQLKGKLSPNEWPITGGKVINAPEVKTHDILLTGHEDGSVDFWDVSDLSMRHLLHLTTSRFFSTSDDDLLPTENSNNDDKQVASANNNNESGKTDDDSSTWPPLKRVGRFDPYSDDTRLAIRKLSLCPRTGTLVVAGTGGQVLVFELKDESSELEQLSPDEITIVSDQRFTWKGREKLSVRRGKFKFTKFGYKLQSYVQLDPPVAPTSLDLRSDWNLYAIGTSYGFLLYEYKQKHSVINRCTLNVQDFAIVSGDAAGTGAISRKKSFRKSLRESFRRLRRGRSQRNQQQPLSGTTGTAGEQVKPAFGGGRVTTGVRTLNAALPSGGGASLSPDSLVSSANHRGVLFSTERQVEQKVELSSIVRCLTLTSAVITNNTSSFKPTLWVGNNSGQVLVYAINLASEQQQQQSQPDAQVAATATVPVPSGEGQEERAASPQQPEQVQTSAKLIKEIQLRHRAPIIAIFTSPDALPIAASAMAANDSFTDSAKSSPEKQLPCELLEGAKSSTECSNDQAAAAESTAAAPPAPALEIKTASKQKENVPQPRVLICSEEQFKVFNLPNFKPFCKFKLTAHEGLRAKKISITQFLKPATSSNLKQDQPSALSASKSLQSFATQTSPPASPVPQAEGGPTSDGSANGVSGGKLAESNNNSLSALNNNHSGVSKSSSSAKDLMNAKFGAKTTATSGSNPRDKDSCAANGLLGGDNQQEAGNLFEPYMVCMSNQGDCAIYSVPDLKRQAQIQVCKREDVNGITSTMLTNYGEGYYLKSSSNFQRFSISTQRVSRVLSVV